MELYHYYWFSVFFVFGACVGSFLNVVIARLPKEESIVHPGSHCPVCGHEIRGRDNIPIISYLLLLGRCRDCGTPISLRYPVIELLTAAVFALLYLRWGFSPATFVYCAFCAALICISAIDIDHMIIPDVISLNAIPIGIAAGIIGVLPGMNWKLAIGGALFGGGVLYLVAKLYELTRGAEGMGGGDIKLLAMIGAFTGPLGVMLVLFVSSVIGTLTATITFLIFRGQWNREIPYGPFLSGAAILYVLVGPFLILKLVRAYLLNISGTF